MFYLNIRHILERACLYFSRKEIVFRTVQGDVGRYSYEAFYGRVCKLANALRSDLNISEGDRVASFGWNTHRHLELHFAAPCIGAVLHTVNIRFSPDEIVYAVNHAEDKVMFLDVDLLPTIESIADKLKTVESFVVMDPTSSVKLRNLYVYEDLINGRSASLSFPDVNENLPAVMCYTTGTTGKPKGVLYTHRGIFLRSMATCLADTYALSERDVIMHVVPMYHISGWFMPYAATLVGSKQVLPGARIRPEILYELIRREKVTVSDGVPTVWIDFLNYVRSSGCREDISSLKRLVVGGSAPPKSLIKAFKEEFGVEVIHAWGMTETYDSAIAYRLKSYLENLSEDDKYNVMAKQGLPFPGIEINALDERGKPIAWNGREQGELVIRGAWIINEYYKDPERTRESFIGDWLRTGDIVTIDGEGYVQIVDRLKDVIKSGGEFISSVALENEIMAHPAVFEAAVIAVPHQRWVERPLACVVLKQEFKGKVSREDIIKSIRDKFPRWWLPDDILFLDEIPKTSVGKFDKKVLRQKLHNYYIEKL
jgi:fatty-acyl-CoA synthase